MRKYPDWCEVPAPAFVQPGDLIVVGTASYPFHGMIVHPDRNLLIHAAPSGVEITSISMPQAIHNVFRLEKWLTPLA